MLYCSFCAYRFEPTDTNGSQCPHCFILEPPVQIYNIDDECPICLDTADLKNVWQCGHWICFRCFDDLKDKLDNLQCQICSQAVTDISISMRRPVQLDIPAELYPSFAALYIRTRRFTSSFVHHTNKYQKHEQSIILLNEYYRWLQLLISAGSTKLSPSAPIDKIWQEHITDGYQTVCTFLLQSNDIIHYHSDPEHYHDQLQHTLKCYHDTYGKPKHAWCWSTPAHIPDNADSHILVQVLYEAITGPLLRFPLDTEMTVRDLKILAEKSIERPADQQRIISRARQLADDDKLSRCGIASGDCLHMLFALKGC